MTTQASAGAGHDNRGGTWLSYALIATPIVLAALCVAAKFGFLDIPSGPRSLLVFVLLFALMLTGMPVSIALGLTVMTFLFTLTQVPLDAVALKLFTGIEKFEIMAIPFFILAGNFITHGGVARRMIRFASSLVGHLPGGLGLAAIVSCALFAAISGSSPATVVAIGSILMPAMVKQGFPMQFGASTVASAGTLGILIPPSIAMVIYSVSTSGMIVTGPTGEKVSAPSIGEMFVAGIVPGLLLAGALFAVTATKAAAGRYPRMQRASWAECGKAFIDSFWGLALIVIILGGIYSGAFTPTEAAAFSAVYAFAISVFVYRDLRLSEIPRVLLASANMSAMLLYIITNAILFSFLMAHENIPQGIAEWNVSQGFGWISFLLIANLVLLLAGCVLEPASIILILAPILFPVAVKLGIDPVHFGILIIVNMEIGMITPPVGLNLYVASGISKLGLTELSKSVSPWLFAMLAYLMLVTYYPPLTTALPKLLGY